MEVQLVAAIISASVAGTVGVMTWLHNRATLREQRIAERRKSIVKQLNEFYGPLVSYLKITNSLYQIYTKDKPKSFRTLTYLLNPEQKYETAQGLSTVVMTESDRIILGEILDLERRVELLVIEKGGLVDDPKLMFEYIPEFGTDDLRRNRNQLSLLALLITHFRVLRLAYEGKLQGEVQRYQDFVFPRDIEHVLRNKFESLHKELHKLSR